MIKVDPFVNTGTLYRSKALDRLGRQGNESFKIAEPFLQSMTQDCNISVGSAPNQFLHGKNTLVVNAHSIIKWEGSFWQKAKQFFKGKIEIAPSQSCTDAVSPVSMAINAIRAKARLLNINPKLFNEQFQEFFSRPEVQEANKDYLHRYTKTPTEKDIKEDLLKGVITATRNGLLGQSATEPF